MRKNADLPFASTLCGSCTNVCPVKIDIHNQLWEWRQVLMREGLAPVSKTVSMKLMSTVFGHSRLFSWSGKLARRVLRRAPWLAQNRLNPWFTGREMPQPPGESFQEWYHRNRANQ